MKRINMKLKHAIHVSYFIMIVFIILLVVNKTIAPIPDFMIRIIGIGLVINIPVLVCLTKRSIDNKI